MRKLIALLLSLAIIVSVPVIPSDTNRVYAAGNNAQQVMNALGIMNTDQGDVNPGSGEVDRGAFAQMLVNMSDMKGKVSSECNVSLFNDVSKKYWAAGYIQAAVSQGWLSGYLDGSFKPDRGVTLQEAVNAILRLLGYTGNDFSGNVSGNQMALYESKELNENISKKKTSYLTATDCYNLFYNTLNSKTKEGKVYAETLGYTMNTDGEMDYLSLVNTGTKGPVVADENWKSELPFSALTATYYRNGKKSYYNEIEDYDVLYYSKSLQTVWAYDEKVTGTVEAINPDELAPDSVTVSGKVYTLETSAMSLAFSSLGSVSEGDIVTLLLGKNNSVAGVLSIDEYNTAITGVVLTTGEHLAEAADGELRQYGYAVYVDASGNEYQQDYDETKTFFAPGDLIRVAFTDGAASVSRYDLPATSFGSNMVSSDASKVGNYTFASNIKILDLSGTNYISIYPERLAGVDLSAGVVYYELNEDHEISQLILKNVTGDLYTYGIFTGAEVVSGKVGYGYVIDGTQGSISGDSLASFDLDAGPQGFTIEAKTPVSSFELQGSAVVSLGTASVRLSDKKFPLAENYDVYYYQNGQYMLTTIDKVSNLTKYDLTAYYDDAVSLGGRIRIIVAKSKA